ncbi:LysR family transcriptional regulator [Mesorhizobium newzealandense]|uniref:LysR family transcriptional regulator n=1 Tax=Mesorhizobium newzealandense TaxID=1300302 RepID=A0ABW4U2B9_9HYPH
MTTSANWALYATFLSVMHQGSLSAAARALGTAQPTVRKQIAELEAALGCVLFTRSKAGLAPTEAAHAAYPFAETMAATANALARSISGQEHDENGVVRITCSEVVGVEVLPPILARLARAHPGIHYEISPTDRAEDMLQRDADVAIRMFRPRESALIARRACTIELGLFASESYLAEHPLPDSFESLLANHRLIGDDRGQVLIAALERQDARLTRKDISWRTDSGLAQLAAVRAGFGVGPSQVPLAGLTNPPLRRVLPWLRADMEAWVVMHEDLKAVHRVRLVFDALSKGLAIYARTWGMQRSSKSYMDDTTRFPR